MGTMKDRFIEIFNQYIKRDGTDKLIEWLEKSDFYTAPASTKYHLACEAGLVTHSVNVFERLISESDVRNNWSTETLAIVSLLHDVCKVNFYKTEYRNAKDETGAWVKVPYYTVEDKFPYGHGEKSVFIISQFMPLTVEESMAIRWHMGGFDESTKGGSFMLSAAFEKYPLALHLHIADLKASYLDEK